MNPEQDRNDRTHERPGCLFPTSCPHANDRTCPWRDGAPEGAECHGGSKGTVMLRCTKCNTIRCISLDEARDGDASCPRCHGPKPNRILCVESGIVFSSAELAAHVMNIDSPDMIVDAADDPGLLAGGRHWRDYSHDFRGTALTARSLGIRPARRRRFKAHRKGEMRAVEVIETGQVFRSATAAANHIGVCSSTILHAASLGHAVGYGSNRVHVRFANKQDTAPAAGEPADGAGDQEFDLSSVRRRMRSIPVMAVETGDVYESMSAAALEVGVGIGSISAAVRNGRMVGGLHWKRVEDATEQ